MRLALKTLNQLGAHQIYRLKTEFRLLASIHHPNVVAVHELFAEHGTWFFTMEAIEGRPIDRFWRASPPPAALARAKREIEISPCCASSRPR